MVKTQMFSKTLIPTNCTLQSDIWDEVQDLYHRKSYKESLLRLFDYINPALAKKTGNATLTEFNIPHGSVVVNLKIENDTVDITVPFLKLSTQNRIPLLRQVSELNFHPLVLASIVLEGDELKFKYTAPLALCEPYKMYYVFREICINADNYDDEFIQKFGASRFQEPKVTQFSQSQVDSIWASFQANLKESAEYIAYFEEKRIQGFVWDILIQTFLQFDYFVAPQGVLRTEIENVISYMQSNNYGFHEKVEKGKTYFKKLQALTKEELSENLYISDLFIPIKFSSNLQNVQEHMENCYETARKEMGNSDFMGATLSIKYIFLYEFYYYYVPDDVNAVMTDALVKSSGLAWNEAAQILWKAIDSIKTGNLSQAKEKVEVKKSGGFLSRLFGK